MAVADCYSGLVISREASWGVEDSWIEQEATGPLLGPKYHVLRGGDHGEVCVLDLIELEGLEDRPEGSTQGILGLTTLPGLVLCTGLSWTPSVLLAGS